MLKFDSKRSVRFLSILCLTFSFGFTQQADKSYNHLLGDWKAQDPQIIKSIDGIDVTEYDMKISGFSLTILDTRIIKIQSQEWYEEGVMYESEDEDEIRYFPSSFAWLIFENSIVFHITFSAAGIPEETELIFPFVYNNEKDELILFTDVLKDAKIIFNRVE